MYLILLLDVCLIVSAWSFQGCDLVQKCPAVSSRDAEYQHHLEDHTEYQHHLEDHPLNPQQINKLVLSENVKSAKHQKIPNNNNNSSNSSSNSNNNEVDVKKFTGSSIDNFPQLATTAPNTNGHFLNSSCYFTDERRVVFICDSLSISSFPQADLPSAVPMFKLYGTSVSSIPSHAFQDMEIDVVSLVDNKDLDNIHRKAFRGVTGLRYLYIRRNSRWEGGQQDRHNQSFFSGFQGADSLIHLVLDSNAITFKEGSSSSPNSTPVLPCLQYLSLAFNPIKRLDDNIFEPLRCSSLTELNLQDTQLQFIGKDTFLPLKHLQHVDFYLNPQLFQPSSHPPFGPPILAAMEGLNQHNFVNLGFSSNSLANIPTTSLAFVKDSLTRLNLALNTFQQLGGDSNSETFPKMEKLEILILDSCRITQIGSSTFENLTSLKVLSMRGNPIRQFHTAFLIPSLEKLDLQIEIQNPPGIESSNHFHFPPEMFKKVNMSSLHSLTIQDAEFSNLTGYHFSGLDNLQILSLDRSIFEEIPNLILGNLSNLKNLSLAYCKSSIPIKLTNLRGPRELRVLDLSNAKIVVEFDHFSGESINTTYVPFPLEYTQVLNLTGSLVELIHPLDHLHFDRMRKLSILEIGKNNIEFWNKTYFNQSFNIKTLRMVNNGKIITLTEEMITDFSNLSVLDLTSNEFICNSQIPAFYKMIQRRNGSLTVLGYREGEGYRCTDTYHDCDNGKGGNSDAEKVSFKYYATCGRDLHTGTDTRVFVPTTAAAGASIGFLVCLALVGYMYKERLYLNYYLLQLRSRYQPRTTRSEPFLYDVFISHTIEDQEWINQHLLPNLEMEHPKLTTCISQRDFEVGKTLTENMVECIDNARKILLIVSESYVRSHWCMFEAHLAQHRLVQDNRQSLIVVTKDEIPEKLLTKKMKLLLKSPSNLSWTSDSKDSRSFWKRLKVTLMKKSDIYVIDKIPEKLLTKKMKLLLKSPSNLSWTSDSKDSRSFWKRLKVTLMKKSDIYVIDKIPENI